MKIAPPESMGTNLTSMIQQIRAVGGEPVMVTSLTRRSFNSDGTVADTLGPWADGKCLALVAVHVVSPSAKGRGEN